MKQEHVKNRIMQYLTIYWTMFKIGITTFGGGYAMVAIIDRELGDRKHWIDKEELLNYIAISQITPGVIAVNVSTFVGRKKAGVPGAIFATLGVITPSLIIIMTIALLITNFADNEYVKHAFAGIRVCVCVLIINATIGFIRKTVVDVLTFIIFLCVFLTAAFTRIETVYIVLAVILCSVIWTLITSGKKSKQPDAAAQAAEGEKLMQETASLKAMPEKTADTEENLSNQNDLPSKAAAEEKNRTQKGEQK